MYPVMLVTIPTVPTTRATNSRISSLGLIHMIMTTKTYCPTAKNVCGTERKFWACSSAVFPDRTIPEYSMKNCAMMTWLETLTKFANQAHQSRQFDQIEWVKNPRSLDREATRVAFYSAACTSSSISGTMEVPKKIPINKTTKPRTPYPTPLYKVMTAAIFVSLSAPCGTA